MDDALPAAPAAAGLAAAPTPASEADRRLVETWAAGQAAALTRASYRHQGGRLLARLGRTLADATVQDLQGYIAGLGDLAPATIGLAVASIKALWAFGRLTGALSADPTATLQAPPIKNVLAERILEEADVRRLINDEPDPRNRALLMLFYGAGLRRAELCGLTWRDLGSRGKDRGQATVFGKGGKTRTVMLYGRAWALVAALRGDADPDAPVFRSAKGGTPRPVGGPPDREEGRGTGRPAGDRLAALASPQLCVTRTRCRRSAVAGTAGARARQRRHHLEIPPRPAKRRRGAVPRALSPHRGAAASDITKGRPR